MARIFTNGFELRSDATGNRSESVEFSNNYLNSANTVCLVNTTTYNPGGGSASLRAFSASAAQRSLWHGLDSSVGTAYVSFYFRVDSYPSAKTSIFVLLCDNTSFYTVAGLDLNTNGTLQLNYSSTSTYGTATVGSASSALTTGQWYRIELYGKVNSASSFDNEFKLNGTVIATGTALSVSGNTSTAMASVEFGLSSDPSVTVTGDWYFDDVIVNDNTGSYENGYPGGQRVVAMRPDGAGSINTLLKTNLSTAGDSNNYQLVDETTPNDATDLVGSKTLNQEDFYTTSASGLTSAHTIKNVAVGYRHKGSGTGGGSFMGLKLEAKVGTGGTVKQSATIVPTSNSEWKTNSNTAASYSAPTLYRPYPLYMYLQPDDSTAWTTTALDDLHVGILAANASSSKFATASAIWAMASFLTKTCAVTGTVTTATETDIVTGGKTIILTLTNDTWKAAGTGPIGSTADTQAIIDGLDSAQSEAGGWDAVVRPGIETADVVRTSDTVCTITLDAEASYSITANETITATIPAAALNGAGALTATPTFNITATTFGVSGSLLMMGLGT